MERRARNRAQKVILYGYVISTIAITILSVWELVQANSQINISSIYEYVSLTLAPLTMVALTYSYWWLARLAIESSDDRIMRRVFPGLAVQTLLITIVSVWYYTSFSLHFQGSLRWFDVSQFVRAIGTAVAFVGFFLMLWSLFKTDSQSSDTALDTAENKDEVFPQGDAP